MSLVISGVTGAKPSGEGIVSSVPPISIFAVEACEQNVPNRPVRSARCAFMRFFSVWPLVAILVRPAKPASFGLPGSSTEHPRYCRSLVPLGISNFVEHRSDGFERVSFQAIIDIDER